MSKSDELLIANEFHPETVAILDDEFHAHKLWLLSAEEKTGLIEKIGPTCKAVATASWVTDPIIYELPELEIISRPSGKYFSATEALTAPASYFPFNTHLTTVSW